MNTLVKAFRRVNTTIRKNDTACLVIGGALLAGATLTSALLTKELLNSNQVVGLKTVVKVSVGSALILGATIPPSIYATDLMMCGYNGVAKKYA